MVAACRLLNRREVVHVPGVVRGASVQNKAQLRGDILETYQLEAKGRHFGGDAAPAGHFVERLAGKAAVGPDLEAGLRSALICLKARESAATSAFLEIEPVTLAVNGEPAPS